MLVVTERPAGTVETTRSICQGKPKLEPLTLPEDYDSAPNDQLPF